MSFTEKLSRYELIITDMDGTLYFQRPVQLLMGMRMALAAVFSGAGRKELSAVLAFRKERETLSEEAGNTGGPSFEDILYERTGAKTGLSAEQVKSAVLKWLYDKPVATVGRFGDRRLIRALNESRKNGITVAILSDYPAREKAEALGVGDYPSYYSGDPRIGTLKPDPAGILYTMEKSGIMQKEKVLVIGDRDSKDGAAARAAGVEYVILRKSLAGRVLFDYRI